MSISIQAKYHIAIIILEAGLVRTWNLSTGLCKASIQNPAGPLSRRDVGLIDGRLLLVWCTPKKIHIWDTEKEKQPRKVAARSNFSTTSLKISGDGSQVFLLDCEHIQALSTETGEVVGKVRLEGDLSNNSLIVDGLRVWVYSRYLLTKGWDFGIPGSAPITLSDEPLPSPRLEFIYATFPHPSRVKDTVTGKDIFKLPKRYKNPAKIQCDGQYLVAVNGDGELLILDFGQMIPQ